MPNPIPVHHITDFNITGTELAAEISTLIGGSHNAPLVSVLVGEDIGFFLQGFDGSNKTFILAEQVFNDEKDELLFWSFVSADGNYTATIFND